MNDLEKRLAAIEERNRRVEDDKAWETSVLRRSLILTTTYVIIGVYLSWLDVSLPWLNAIVPALGFLLSTLAMQKAKEFWLRRRND